MVQGKVVLIAFEDFDNLGVRYVASTLLKTGYEPVIIDFRNKREMILERIKDLEPIVTGFSIIFQYHIYEFRNLVNYLREHGIISHFSAGGQYASLRYEELFSIIPGIDSIVRFEGEYTFPELVANVQSGSDWKRIKGIAYRIGNKTVSNPLRPPELDLDKFPYPFRGKLHSYIFGKKFATIIASRGCTNNCSFCNNTEYIRRSRLPVKRIRKPEQVVGEMLFLYQKKNCSVFLFEDDDFPVRGIKGFQWVKKFCSELESSKLKGRIVWKINCRPDDISLELFSMMKDHGLFLVFLGLDDGTDTGLESLNKNMTTDQSLGGVNVLKNLNICFDYGFMLFQPWSTFKSVYDNLNFLKLICGDGSSAVKFLKLMPYFETKIETMLINEGRLATKSGIPSYDFLNPNLERYYDFAGSAFSKWISHPEGVTAVADWVRIYISIYGYLYGMNAEVNELSADIQAVIAESNLFILDILIKKLKIYETAEISAPDQYEQKSLENFIKMKHKGFKKQLISKADRICQLAEYHELHKLIKPQG